VVTPDTESHWPTAAEVERHHLQNTLEHAGYNISAAARLLDLDRHSLRRRIKNHQVNILRPERGRPSNQSQPKKKAA
jgi:transcriptional regulator with GAF, ATPase, and Fis domain